MAQSRRDDQSFQGSICADPFCNSRKVRTREGYLHAVGKSLVHRLLPRVRYAWNWQVTGFPVRPGVFTLRCVNAEWNWSVAFTSTEASWYSGRADVLNRLPSERRGSGEDLRHSPINATFHTRYFVHAVTCIHPGLRATNLPTLIIAEIGVYILRTRRHGWRSDSWDYAYP